ncbi:MAG: hypothetical protein A2987_01035 [Omnitrophica bacterium RIFCSPLOWO2_01_FULL_45_10]|nr:MAG: hypothetical protein A2987_01035 [Omnitrophica bacterium RIFCSPLOWO2_01_FULL_45_10]
MKAAFTALSKNLLNIIFPLRCAACKKDLDAMNDFGVCDSCAARIRRLPRPYCERCGRSIQSADKVCGECRKTSHYFNAAYSACLYEGVLKELIHLFKYKGRYALINILSTNMIEFARELRDELLEGVGAITFVPLQDARLRERGFNQSKVLALSLSKEFGITLLDTLKKTRPTMRQNELSRSERLVNLEDAFKIKGGIDFASLKVLLIDDVMTTGATLDECSKALISAGAKEIRCLTLARGM